MQHVRAPCSFRLFFQAKSNYKSQQECGVSSSAKMAEGTKYTQLRKMIPYFSCVPSVSQRPSMHSRGKHTKFIGCHGLAQNPRSAVAVAAVNRHVPVLKSISCREHFPGAWIGGPFSRYTKLCLAEILRPFVWLTWTFKGSQVKDALRHL